MFLVFWILIILLVIVIWYVLSLLLGKQTYNFSKKIKDNLLKEEEFKGEKSEKENFR